MLTVIREVLVCTRSSDPPYGPMDGPVQDRMLRCRDSYSETPYKRNSGPLVGNGPISRRHGQQPKHSYKRYKLDPEEADARTP